jgi:hypothetical protein
MRFRISVELVAEHEPFAFKSTRCLNVNYVGYEWVSSLLFQYIHYVNTDNV